MKHAFQNLLALLFPFICGQALAQNKIYLDEIPDIEKFETGWSTPHRKTNLSKKPISLSGTIYERGICVHAFATLNFQLDGKAVGFHALLGLDDMVAKLGGHSVQVRFFVDEKPTFRIDTLKPGQKPITVDFSLKNGRMLTVEIEGIGGTWHTHTDLADAWISYEGLAPSAYEREIEKPYLLTPAPKPGPKLTGPQIFGLRPGSPILHRITATGTKPIRFSASGLPEGVKLEPTTGQLYGQIETPGTYLLTIKASNAIGTHERRFKLVVGDKLALTPPLGWNSWNCWGMAVDQQKVWKAAKAMARTGLIDHGWTYINIDDGWQADSRNPETGEILANPKTFPNLKGLVDSIHALGLKAGIYSSPGLHTCGKRLGSLGHEEEDASTYNKWGIDFLKYDYCSYSDIAKQQNPENKYAAIRPYTIMGKALARQNRDIVYSICQYGELSVWEWGEKVNGNLWRTTGDIIDTWNSMRTIGMGQDAAAPYTKPGRWADPDMLVVGQLGWGPQIRPTRLTPHEQYTHISLWAMLSAPMLLGCDLDRLDDFTLNLLTNDEVLEINQDELGKQAVKIWEKDRIVAYLKELENGDKALCLINLALKDQNVALNLNELGLKRKFTIRDVWRQRNIAKSASSLAVAIPRHGASLLRLKPTSSY